MQRPAEQFGTKTRRVHEQVSRDSRTRFGNERPDAFALRFRAHGGIHDLHTLATATVFQPANEFFVFDVERMIVMELRQTVGAPREDFVVRHERRSMAEPREFFGVVKAVVAREFRQAPF